MALDDFSLNVSSTRLAEARRWLIAKLSERFSTTDWASGAAHGLIVLPTATILAALADRIDAINKAHNLNYIASGEASDDEITEFLYNYRIIRKEPAVATGKIRLVVSRNSVLFVASGTRFVAASGIGFITTADVYGVPGTPANNSEQQFKQFGSNWYIVLPAAAENPGVAGNIPAGTVLTPDGSIANFVAAAADDTFVGGRDRESVTSIMSRLLSGISAGAFSSPAQLLSLIRSATENGIADPALAHTTSVNIVGSGNPEMMRDKRGLFPVAISGRADVYAKTSAQPTTAIIRVLATLIGRTPVEGDGIWRFTIGRDAAPGFYRVQKVVAPGDLTSASYTITGDVRGYDITADGRYIPDIEHAYEAVYSPYQTATITFVDTDRIVEDGDIGNVMYYYDAHVLYMPNLRKLQQFLSDDAIRPPGMDVLVRAPVPMFVTVGVSLSSTPDADTYARVLSAVMEFIASCPIGHTLSQAQVAGAIAAAIPSTIRVVSVSLSGSIADVTGGTISVTMDANGKLNIPDQPSKGVTNRTVCLITSPGSITIT